MELLYCTVFYADFKNNLMLMPIARLKESDWTSYCSLLLKSYCALKFEVETNKARFLACCSIQCHFWSQSHNYSLSYGGLLNIAYETKCMLSYLINILDRKHERWKHKHCSLFYVAIWIVITSMVNFKPLLSLYWKLVCSSSSNILVCTIYLKT